MEINKTYNIDALDGTKALPDQSIDCIITSPPYFGLRDYGVNGQIGLEDTPEQYIEKLIPLFRELRRALNDKGTAWINIGDSYAGSNRAAGDTNKSPKRQPATSQIGDVKKAYKSDIIKPKDLIGIPWMLAFALRADGWYLRQDIIWHKPNPMPESVTDRCTKSHEYIFLLTKSSKYYFDAESIAEPSNYPVGSREDKKRGDFKGKYHAHEEFKHISDSFRAIRETRNKRDVWSVCTKPLHEAHFAPYPEELIAPCVLAGCPKDGVVLDPFHGSGTTGIVASKLGRNYIGFELNPEYIKIENRRRHKELGLFI